MLHTRKDNVTLPVGVMGTVAIQLPSIAATTWTQSTIVTVPGIMSGDALAVWLNGGTSAGYGDPAGATARVIYAAQPSDGSMIVTFANGGCGTGVVQYILTYVTAR